MANHLSVDAPTVTAFLLVLTRTSTWIVTVPLLGMKSFTPTARIGLSVAVALAMTPVAAHYTGTHLPTDLASFVTAVAYQVLTGLLLGVTTGFLLQAAEFAGSIADYSSGFAYGAILDPTNGQASSVFSRLFNMSFIAMAFATDAHHTLLTGFAGSFAAVPLNQAPVIDAGSAAAAGHAITQLGIAGIEIGGPLLGVLFLTDFTLGLAARFVPQANLMSVGLPLKALVALGAAGATLSLMPARIGPLVDNAAQMVSEVLK